MRKTLVLFLLIQSILLITTQKEYWIVGAGPIGLYLANRLLESGSTNKVRIFESRTFTRPQCLRLPVENARKFPDAVREKLWPNKTIRENIFSNKSKKDKDFWPKPGYPHYPRINIADLQQVFKDYLEASYSTRFQFIKKRVTSADVVTLTPNEVAAVFVTSGNGDFNTEIRTHLFNTEELINDLAGRTALEKMGLFGIFSNPGFDDYYRSGKMLQREALSAVGLTYSATNNARFEVQMYTYPMNSFLQLYQSMPESVKSSAKFPKFIDQSRAAAGAEAEWFNSFRAEVVKLNKAFAIDVPADLKVYYAERWEYAFRKAYGFNEFDLPFIFLGDSLGGTDYKFGLNVGRGMYSVDAVVRLLERNSEFETAKLFQDYWQFVVNTEFAQDNPKLTDDPWVFYKYVVLGRTVEGRVLSELDFHSYLEELKVAPSNLRKYS